MENMVNEIKAWIYQAGEMIKTELSTNSMKVDTKSSRTDLVTNIDKATQDFLVERIMAFDPNAKILGEENGQNELTDLSGRVFIIDPIDGTMNFVLEHQNFCVMVAVYEEGAPKLGFVYNVMKDEFLWGGHGLGVYLNDKKIEAPADKSLSDGLVGLNHVMFQRDDFHLQEIGNIAMGVRMMGCAGMELIDVCLGRKVAYISALAPWDYAPGGVLVAELGLCLATIKGKPLKLHGREVTLAATPAAYAEIVNIVNG